MAGDQPPSIPCVSFCGGYNVKPEEIVFVWKLMSRSSASFHNPRFLVLILSMEERKGERGKREAPLYLNFYCIFSFFSLLHSPGKVCYWLSMIQTKRKHWCSADPWWSQFPPLHPDFLFAYYPLLPPPSPPPLVGFLVSDTRRRRSWMIWYPLLLLP